MRPSVPRTWQRYENRRLIATQKASVASVKPMRRYKTTSGA